MLTKVLFQCKDKRPHSNTTKVTKLQNKTDEINVKLCYYTERKTKRTIIRHARVRVKPAKGKFIIFIASDKSKDSRKNRYPKKQQLVM